jgi:hypothetical protein
MVPRFDRLWTDCIKEKTWLVSKDSLDGLVKRNSDGNPTPTSCTRKGRRVSLGRRNSPEKESSLELRWKKDLTNMRCFDCHYYGHYDCHGFHTIREGEEGSSRG